ncbi:acyl-CoA dehydrogenase family protein [Bordetella tumulicola]|uniref:acyl-CoA dehydrogenase family protein n=1 Tax=Bordetella tumulicola TaxID=1649133 RepID=UPI0039EE1D54
MTIARPFFTEAHDAFRDTVRRFIEKEIAPHHAQWEIDGKVPRELWQRAGELGILCPSLPEEYGGSGADWLFDVIVIEELWHAGMSGPGSAFMVHAEMVASYIYAWGSDEQKKTWLPKMARGEVIGAIGMSEPSGGSDLQNMTTRAERVGDEYVINGQKIFITNGVQCDLLILAAKTDSTAGKKGISLILVEADRPGFQKARALRKVGTHAQDTAELFFADLHVPISNRLGEENRGFKMLMTKLAQERLCQAVRSTTVCEAAIEWTVRYTRDRKAFGKTIADFQNTRFVLAQLDAETTSARIFTDWCIRRFMEGELSPIEAAKAKLISTELQGKVLDQCLQFFGGYGYMLEYPIARAFIDARLTRIGGGTIEIMKQIISNDLFERVA